MKKKKEEEKEEEEEKRKRRKRKRNQTQINKIRNEKGEITTDTTEIKWIVRHYYE